eukprot:jgi/Tetstr1/443529/TSEL_031533.t1
MSATAEISTRGTSTWVIERCPDADAVFTTLGDTLRESTSRANAQRLRDSMYACRNKCLRYDKQRSLAPG